MCNSLHLDSTPIPKEGFGWKMFIYKSDMVKLYSLGHKNYKSNHNGIAKWNDIYDDIYYDGVVLRYKKNKRSGFCFFLEEGIANMAETKWINCLHERIVVVKIKYYDGMGTHTETHFIGGEKIPIALCGSFEIISDQYTL